MDFFISFLIYLLVFAIGSLLALLVARKVYPAVNERQAFAELTDATNGAVR